ncbi:MAG: hypothetical protein JNL74_14495 [Fibrobacteres bacterium]|nr:hypothetical protein [Fibrobacterota bacterium]
MLKLVLILAAFALSAELTVSEKLQELSNAGQFVRKTTFFLPKCFFKDDLSNFQSSEEERNFIRMFREALAKNSRLYHDTLPPAMESQLISSLNSRFPDDTSKFRVYLENAFNSASPEILAEHIKSSSMKRAEHLLNDQQKNSFFTMKAKESGVTATEISVMLQAAYLICPVVKKIERKTDTTGAKIQCGPGFTIFNLKVDSTGKIRLNTIDDFLVRANGSESHRNLKNRIEEGKLPRGTTVEQAALYKMVENGQDDLILRLRENENFQMTAQVADAGFIKLSMQMPRKEASDLSVADFYRVLELEDKNGKIVKNRIGWFFANKMDFANADTGDNANVNVEGRMVSGRASTGLLVQELPLSKGLLTLSFDKKSYSVDIDSFPVAEYPVMFDSVKVEAKQQGIGASIFVYLPRQGSSLDQLGLTASYTTNKVDGNIYIADTGNSNNIPSLKVIDPSFNLLHAGLTYQRGFPSFRRLFYGLYFSADYELLSFKGNVKEKKQFSSDTLDLDFKLERANIAGSAGAYSEFYLFPSLSFGARAGYRYAFPIQKWDFSLKNGTEDVIKLEKELTMEDGITSNGLEMFFYMKINLWPIAKLAAASKNK